MNEDEKEKEEKEEIIEQIYAELGDAIPSSWDTTIEDWAFELGGMFK